MEVLFFELSIESDSTPNITDMSHDHSDTRLSCTDCSEPICPKCMVQCAVGNRCKKCAGKFSTHLVKMTPVVITKVVLLSFVSAYLILAADFVASSSVPICMISPITVAVSAYFLGGFIHKASGYKDGKLLTPFILIPLVIGFLLNPFGVSPIDFIRLMTVAGAPLNFGLFLPFLFTPILSCFMILVQLNKTRSI